jgi:predicted SpoU family rRNA methylase
LQDLNKKLVEKIQLMEQNFVMQQKVIIGMHTVSQQYYHQLKYNSGVDQQQNYKFQ